MYVLLTEQKHMKIALVERYLALATAGDSTNVMNTVEFFLPSSVLSR